MIARVVRFIDRSSLAAFGAGFGCWVSGNDLGLHAFYIYGILAGLASFTIEHFAEAHRG